jgi:rhodanese-related sulfurtransferase
VSDVPLEIGVEDLKVWRDEGREFGVLDVRETWEYEICRVEGSLNVPMAAVPDSLERLPPDGPLVVVCHHGGRSMRVVSWLREQGVDRAVNVSGGVDRWAECVEPGMQRY